MEEMSLDFTNSEIKPEGSNGVEIGGAQEFLEAQRKKLASSSAEQIKPAVAAIEWFQESGFATTQERIKVLKEVKGMPEAADRAMGAKVFYDNSFKPHIKDMENGTSSEVPADVLLEARKAERDLLQAINEATN